MKVKATPLTVEEKNAREQARKLLKEEAKTKRQKLNKVNKALGHAFRSLSEIDFSKDQLEIELYSYAKSLTLEELLYVSDLFGTEKITINNSAYFERTYCYCSSRSACTCEPNLEVKTVLEIRGITRWPV